MQLRLEARTETARWLMFATPLLAAALTLVCGIVLFAALGYAPGRALASFFVKPIDSLDGVAELGLKATPLLLCALGLAVGFRGNVWNIGAEGQLTMGAIAAGGLALAFHGQEPWWLLPAMIVAGGPRRGGGGGGAGGAARDERGGRPRRGRMGGDPGVPAHALQCERDPDQPDADLRRHTALGLSR